MKIKELGGIVKGRIALEDADNKWHPRYFFGSIEDALKAIPDAEIKSLVATENVFIIRI